MKKYRFHILFCMTLLVLTVSGCRSIEDYEKDRAVWAAQHLEESKWNRFRPSHIFTLDECLELAMRFNLDLRVAKLEEDVASQQKIVEALGMLPELNVTENNNYRNNVAASSSAQINGGNGYGTYSYSTSQDQLQNLLNVD